MTRSYTIAVIIGAVLGLGFSWFALVYAPMKANYERNGCVWLECSAQAVDAKERKE